MMITLLAALILTISAYELGRHVEARRCNADLRRLGRHIDRQINEHREAIRNLP